MTRLLIADDAPFIREIVRTIAEKNGLDLVGEAVDGHDAIAQALMQKPDVVLMDIIMPRLSGIEATKAILAKLPDTKIIAFSTADQEIMVMKALEAGCCSYLAKPFQAEGLLSAIAGALKAREK